MAVTYKVLVKVSLRLAVGDASHRLVVVELVTELAEISRHRDHVFHAYTQPSHQHHCSQRHQNKQQMS